ncbi:MAG: hypothetical protein ACI86H_001842 [bacterium]|jgi:hypothetical protein
MAVPRKKRKLDQVSATSEKTSSSKKVKSEGKDPSRATVRHSREKLDKAFEVIDDLEKIYKKDVAQEQKFYKKKPRGFHFSFSLDAVLHHSLSKPEKEPVFQIQFTLPFLSEIPIIGGIAHKVLKKIKPFKNLPHF